MRNIPDILCPRCAAILVTVWALGFHIQDAYADYPPPSSVNYQDFSLVICPPDSLPGPPIQLLGYTIYVNGAYTDYMETYPPYDTVTYFFEEGQLIPGFSEFCVKAVYNEWISEVSCDSGLVMFGESLPFLEDWASGDFESNGWLASGDHWVISTDTGQAVPSAAFIGSPAATSYSYSLESGYFMADTLLINEIYVEYDLKLVSNTSSGTEKFRLEVWDSQTQIWHHWNTSTNANGSFDWDHYSRPVSTLVKGKSFKIRFLVFGTNSTDIQGWYLDNISIRRSCRAPQDLETEAYGEYTMLIWYGLTGYYPYYYHWDDGANYVSIGTGWEVEFDVAARWLPSQMINMGLRLTKVRFVPSEELATYRIRVWQGDTADVLRLDQAVSGLQIGEWNDITLETPLIIDKSKELWVGYHVQAQTGYPAGCDDGPAIDGQGNMINFGGWQTLLQLNPELDYNWNIQVKCEIVDSSLRWVNIYRQDLSEEEFYWLDSTTNLYFYKDFQLQLNHYYCYKVSAFHALGSDSCESALSNESCWVPLSAGEDPGTPRVSIFPNPAAAKVSIRSEGPLVHIEVFNSLGLMVFSMETEDKHAEFNAAFLPNGLYLIKIRSGDKDVIKKLIVYH